MLHYVPYLDSNSFTNVRYPPITLWPVLYWSLFGVNFPLRSSKRVKPEMHTTLTRNTRRVCTHIFYINGPSFSGQSCTLVGTAGVTLCAKAFFCSL